MPPPLLPIEPQVSAPSPVYADRLAHPIPAPHLRNEGRRASISTVRLERKRELTSETSQVEDRFTATTVVDLYQGNDVLIPAGSTVRGVVSSVTKATRTDRKGGLTVAFDQITVHGKSYPMHATVKQAIESVKGPCEKPARLAPAPASARSSAASSAARRARCWGF